MKKLLLILLCLPFLFSTCKKEENLKEIEETITNSWDCVNGACVDPGDGSGSYITLADCQQQCVGFSSNSNGRYNCNYCNEQGFFQFGVSEGDRSVSGHFSADFSSSYPNGYHNYPLGGYYLLGTVGLSGSNPNVDYPISGFGHISFQDNVGWSFTGTIRPPSNIGYGTWWDSNMNHGGAWWID